MSRSDVVSRLGCRALLIAAVVPCGCGETIVDPGDVKRVDVATSSAQEGWAVNYPKQRKVLFMAGRLWVFYSDGRDVLVRSTPDGATLSPPQAVRQGMVFGHRCMFAFDGTFVHYACCDALDGSDVLYRRGAPHDDGTIEWGAEQVAFHVAPGQSVLYPKVMVDAARRTWVAFMLFEGGFMTAPQSAQVTRSSRADGQWSTDAGFPFALVSGSIETYPDPLGVALASGGTFWIYDHDGSETYYGRPWTDGAGWGPEERVTTTRQKYGLFDAVAEGDDVHLSFGGGTVRYRRRSAGGQWGDERVVGSGSGHTSIAALGRGHALITWLDVNGERVLEREVWDGGAGPALLLVDARPQGLAGTRLGINLNGLAGAAAGFRAAVTTTIGADAPFRIVLATR